MVKRIVTNWNYMLTSSSHEQTREWQTHHASEDPPRAFFRNFSIRHSTLCYLLPPSPFIYTYTHKLPTHTCFHKPYHLLLEMSTRGEIRGNTAHRGSLSWYARLVILQSQFLSIWWAPVCHLLVYSMCPKLWLPPLKCILWWYSCLPWQSYSTSQLACTNMAKIFSGTLQSYAWTVVTSNNVPVTSLISVIFTHN